MFLKKILTKKDRGSNMTICISAYDTAAGSGYSKSIAAIKDELSVVEINQQYVQDENNKHVRRIYSHDIGSLSVFTHPIVKQKDHDENNVYIDLRSFTRLDKASGDYVIKLNNEAIYEINRAHLNEVWVNRDPFVLLNISPVPITVFAGWISENIARRFALTPREQLSLAIFSAYYYYCLFTDNDKFDEEDTNRIISSISRNLRCSSMDVIEILDKTPFVIENLKTFCTLLEEVTGSVRLKNFSLPVIYQLLNNSWFGLNARELIGVALEHPPTWIALVHAAYTERTYRNTVLARSAEKKASKAAIDSFNRSIYNLITSD